MNRIAKVAREYTATMLLALCLLGFVSGFFAQDVLAGNVPECQYNVVEDECGSCGATNQYVGTHQICAVPNCTPGKCPSQAGRSVTCSIAGCPSRGLARCVNVTGKWITVPPTPVPCILPCNDDFRE
jgi:hypothetical protein